MEKDNFFIDDKANFKDEDVSIFKTGKGLNENVIREISRIKNEPEFMLELRLKAYHEFERHPNPKFGPDLSFMIIHIIQKLLIKLLQIGKKFQILLDQPLIN